jgi:hypothetical protein
VYGGFPLSARHVVEQVVKQMDQMPVTVGARVRK